jgi:hypothetical protein
MFQGGGHDLGETPAWDPVNKAHYYDYDVTGFVNDHCKNDGTASFVLRLDTKEESTISVSIDGSAGTKAPQLIISRKDVYDWTYLDKVIGWAEEAGIKLEILWFGSDTCSISSDNRVPFYAFHLYEKSVKSTGTPFFSKQAANSQYWWYWYLLCKNDPGLQAQERKVLKDLFNHIAEYNASHGDKKIVIGCQVSNEPGVALLHGSGQGDRCYSEHCTAIYNEEGSAQAYRDRTMWEYNNNLAEGVKESNYPVWTRVNNYVGTDAKGVVYNENKRSAGGTSLDFIGIDYYSVSESVMYNFGHTTATDGINYSQGKNLPMIMEAGGGEQSGTPKFILAALAGGAFYNIYDLCSSDGKGLYDDAGKTGTLTPHGSYVAEVRQINFMLKKISYDLATKLADGAGGSKLRFFNHLSDTSSNTTENIQSLQLNYTTTNGGVGIAIAKAKDTIVLASTTASTFVLKNLGTGSISSVEKGYYDGLDWVREGTLSYTGTATTTISMEAYDCVRIIINGDISDIPMPGYGTITGKASDPGGTGIPGVTVKVEGDGGVYTAVTDTSGNYSITNVVPETGLIVKAQRNVSPVETQSGISVTEGGSVIVNFTLTPMSTTTVYYAEDFSAYPVGAFTGDATWTVGNSNTANHTVEFIENPDLPGDKILHMKKTGSGTFSFYNSSEANAGAGTVIIEMRIMGVELSSNTQFGMYAFNKDEFSGAPPSGNGAQATIVMYDGAIRTHATTGSSTTTKVIDYESGKWYTVAVVVYNATDTFDFWVDGEKIITGGNCRKTGKTEVDYFYTYSNSSSAGDFYIDYLKIVQPQ